MRRKFISVYLIHAKYQLKKRRQTTFTLFIKSGLTYIDMFGYTNYTSVIWFLAMGSLFGIDFLFSVYILIPISEIINEIYLVPT